MASLYARGLSVWIKYIDDGGTPVRRPTGIRVKEWKFRNGDRIFPKEALELVENIAAKTQLRQWDFDLRPKKSTVRLSDLLARFLAEKGGTRKKSTQAGYKHSINTLTAFLGDAYISSLTRVQLFTFRQHLISKVGDVNAARVITALGPLFTWAADRELIRKHPITKDVRIHPSFPQPAIYTFEEVDKLLAYARNTYVPSTQADKTQTPGDPALANQLQFLSMTGFRSGESCHLRIDQLDVNNKFIRHQNEKEERWELYPIDPDLEEFLKSLPRTYEPYVFKYRSTSTLGHRTREIADKLGFDPRIKPVHGLKKTYGKRLLQSGAHFSEIARLMHHKSYQTTEAFYNAFSLDELRDTLAKSRKIVSQSTKQ